MPDDRRNRVAGGSCFFTLAARRPAQRSAAARDRGAARGRRAHTTPARIPGRRQGGAAGAHARAMDPSRARRRVVRAMGVAPAPVLGGDSTGRAPHHLPRGQRRARALAASLPGTHGARCRGFRPARRLHSLQSGQARAGGERGRLAMLIVRAGGGARVSSSRLGAPGRERGRLRRAGDVREVVLKRAICLSGTPAQRQPVGCRSAPHPCSPSTVTEETRWGQPV